MPPSEAEINIYDSLDERVAVRNFLGKSLTEAEELFRENALYHQESLMFMGPRAFCFYIDAYIAYLQSDKSRDNADAANCFLHLIDYRLDCDGEAIRDAVPKLTAAARYMAENIAKFDIILDIYGDVGAGFVKLHERLSRDLSGG